MKKSRSLVSIILTDLLVCLLIIAADLAAIYVFSKRIVDDYWERTDISCIISQKKKLKSEQYRNIKAGGGYGFNGYFEVLDKRAKVIYTSSKTKKNNSYTKDTLTLIPDSESGRSIYIEKNEETGDYVITFYSTDKNGEEYNQDVMIVEPEGVKGVVIFSAAESVYDIDDTIDLNTLRLLEKSSENASLQKYMFKTYDGRVRYLMYHIGNRSKVYSRLEDRVMSWSIVIFITLIIVIITAFSIHLLRIIRAPMRMLIEDMRDFAEDRKVNASADGIRIPKEFYELDISLEELEQKLIDSDDEKKRLEDEKQQILTDISHDLKTPATVIQGYSEALADGIVSDSEREEYIGIIKKRSENLSELINTFFEYNKMNYNGFRIVKENDDICEFFREYFADRYRELTDKGCTIDVDIPDDIIKLSFDHVLMRRCFDNIVNNSVNHNEGRTGIYAKLEEDREDVFLFIGDHGKGIPADIRSNVFAPFVTENRSRTSGMGTGLGLSIAKRIVELHGGSVQLAPEGELGCSVLFKICLHKELER